VTDKPKRKAPEPVTTRALVDQLAEGDPNDTIKLAELVDRFSERSFGVFLLLVLLPTFIPIPVGMGAVSGGLASLIGLQFLARLEHPWLPGFVGRWEIHRHRMISFRNRMGKWLDRLEKLTKPRKLALLQHPLAHAFTGFLLVVLGVLLCLPLPLTNYPFGLILLAFSFALIERDGVLMLIAWGLGLTEIAIVAGFSSEIVTWTGKLFS
jgi:hypothetical protein